MAGMLSWFLSQQIADAKASLGIQIAGVNVAVARVEERQKADSERLVAQGAQLAKLDEKMDLLLQKK